jgi:hypothetical protein
MEIFNVTTKKKIRACKLTFREIMMQQYKTCWILDTMKFDLVISQRTSIKDSPVMLFVSARIMTKSTTRVLNLFLAVVIWLGD